MPWEPLFPRDIWSQVMIVARCRVCDEVAELNRDRMICTPCQRAAFETEEALRTPVCECSARDRRLLKKDGVHAPYCPMRGQKT